MAFETEVVSHDIGTICARILEQKKRYLSFFSNTTLNVLHRLKMRCSHLCVMKLVHQFRNFFFWLLSLFFVCFSSFFFCSSFLLLLLLHSKRNKKRLRLNNDTPTNTQTEEQHQRKKINRSNHHQKSKMQGARHSDVFFGERESGQDVRQSNVTAVQAVANIVKSSLGPVGLDKVV